MIVLFTDFGLHSPYTGQIKAVLHQMVPTTSIIDLFAVGNPKASASAILNALAGEKSL
jgi:S-adenosylmethionine hydrolase